MTATKEQVWAVLKTPTHLKLLENDADLYTIDEFRQCVQGGMFINDDGMGDWATATHYQNTPWVYPSEFKSGAHLPPPWATHVVWYNK